MIYSFISLATSYWGRARDPADRPSPHCLCVVSIFLSNWAPSSSTNAGRADASCVQCARRAAPWKSLDWTRSSYFCDERHCHEIKNVFSWYITISLGTSSYIPLANVKDPRPFNNHCVQFPLQTLLWYVLQRPIPVVVIVAAEVPSAAPDARPSGAIEGEAHVMFAADPGHGLHLWRGNTWKWNGH